MTQISTSHLAAALTTAAALLPFSAKADWAGDFAASLEDTFKEMGVLYKAKKKKNPYIQEVSIFGRLHYQVSHSDGKVKGRFRDLDFHESGDELRRLRLGAKVEFLKDFEFSIRGNFEEGGYRNHDLGFRDMDEVYLTYTADDLLTTEKLTVGYGIWKVPIGGEWALSSKELRTVERAAISNFYAPERATGAIFGAEWDDVELFGGIYTADDNDEGISSWNGGEAYYLGVEWDYGPGDLRLDYLKVNANPQGSNDDSFNETSWATSLTWTTDWEPDFLPDDLELLATAIYGETQAGHKVYGVVIQPSLFVIKDRLELVASYSWAHATANVFPGNNDNRGLQAAYQEDIGANPNNLVGDDYHSIYGGVNYHLVDKFMKVMVGVEYETLDNSTEFGDDVEGTTVWGAFRFHF